MKRIAPVVLVVLAVGALSVVLFASGSRAQVRITMEPAMTKGAATSAVTIVEFSDYQ